MDHDIDAAIAALRRETHDAVETWRAATAEDRRQGAVRDAIMEALRGPGEARGLFRPWVCEDRIGYRTIRERAHLDDVAAFVDERPHSTARHADRQLRWHDDQHRRGRSPDPADRAFLGDGLYDAVAHGWLTACGKSSDDVREWLRGSRDYGRQSHVLVPRDVIGPLRGTLEFHVTRNQVRSVATLADGIHWRRGYMRFDRVDMPETVVLSLKGRPLDDLIEHPFVSGRGIVITSMTRDDQGRMRIGTTDAARHVLVSEDPWADAGDPASPNQKVRKPCSPSPTSLP